MTTSLANDGVEQFTVRLLQFSISELIYRYTTNNVIKVYRHVCSHNYLTERS